MKKGWEIKAIGDTCTVTAGQSPEGKFYNSDGNGLPFYQGKKDFGEKFIEAPSTWTTQTTKIARAGDILMSVRAPVGPVNFANDEICIGRGLAAIRGGSDLNRDFLFYQLLHLQPVIAGREGAVFASINKSEIEALPIAFAPLPEQQRIVGILDEAFAGIATAKANAEKNLHNARALFESHLQSVFTQRGAGWVEKRFDDFCSFENGDRGTNYPSKSTRTATGIPFINAGHLTDDGLDLETMDYIPRERFNLLSNGKIRQGDILFCLRGSLGKFASVGDLLEGAIASSLVIVRPNKTVLKAFLIAFFRSPLCAAMINRFKNGAAQPNLSAQSLRNFIAPVPPLAEQESIVERLGALRAQTQRLTSIYQQKLDALEALKKSLLHQAFTGAL